MNSKYNVGDIVYVDDAEFRYPQARIVKILGNKKYEVRLLFWVLDSSPYQVYEEYELCKDLSILRTPY